MEASEYFAMAKLLLAFRKFPFYYNLLKLPMHSLCITCKVNTATLWNRDGLAKVVFKDAVRWQLRNENFIQPLQSMHRHLTDTCGLPQTNPSHLFQFKMKIWVITSWTFSNLGFSICSACGLHPLWLSLPTQQFKWKPRNYNSFSPVQLPCCVHPWTSTT